jgi:hypothetical protein
MLRKYRRQSLLLLVPLVVPILAIIQERSPTLSKWTILCCMDHIEVLRTKIVRLRTEIAEIQALNKQYRLRDWNGAEAQVAHGQRQERLQAIQQELAQLASLGRKVQSVEEMKERHRSRLYLVKKAS